MIQTRRTNPRAEYRILQTARINESVSLAEKFPRLKSLSINLEYYDAAGVTRNGEMKYKANLTNAKSVFYFNCLNGECVGGDFDLSKELATAIASKLKMVTGEMRCLGMRHNKLRGEHIPCKNILRYKLALAY